MRDPVPRAPHLIPAGKSIVVYSWGPGCNGSTGAALAFAALGYPVREMIGGIEYWARNGLGVQRTSGATASEPDKLVTAYRPAQSGPEASSFSLTR